MVYPVAQGAPCFPPGVIDAAGNCVTPEGYVAPPTINPANQPGQGVNVEDGPPRVVIPYVQHKLRAETRVVGESFDATFSDLTGDDQGYFKLLTREWESGRGFVLCEQDVKPSVELLNEMWSCPAEWCSAFFYAWDGAVIDGESQPRHPRRYRIFQTLALNKFGSSLLRRAPRAMQDAAARTQDMRHFNQLDVVLVNPGAAGRGVLQGHPYSAVPHVHGPVDHRPPPAWAATMTESDWADG